MNAGDSFFKSILPPSFRFWIFLWLFRIFNSFLWSVEFLDQGHIRVFLRVEVEVGNLIVMEAGSTKCLGIFSLRLVTISVVWWQYRLNLLNLLSFWWQYRLFWWQYRMLWWQYRWILVTISVIWWQYRLLIWNKLACLVSLIFPRMFSIMSLDQACPNWFSASFVLASYSSMPTFRTILVFDNRILLFCHFLI